ncbi:MAG TPA: maleylpyruvate isomerase family mycothiol-dependent enzyme, partial [Streptosporangiaceae bacterium]|nr:maleylpyruvate isomerase family mycothiol-dependent enzyme [Streptosporangiaceae bacterium]
MPEPRALIAALRSSFDRLDSLVTPLSPAQLAGPSYCDEWTIAQVLSHLGSGAEISALLLDAGLAGREPPGRESFLPIWDGWNARSPQQQATGWRSSDAALVERFESLTGEELARFHIDMFGMELDAAGLASMRLSEHIMHTWDVAVALDPAARLTADGVDLLAGTLGQFAGRIGKPQGEHFAAVVHTTGPRRDLLLTVGDSVKLTGTAGTAGT